MPSCQCNMPNPNGADEDCRPNPQRRSQASRAKLPVRGRLHSRPAVPGRRRNPGSRRRFRLCSRFRPDATLFEMGEKALRPVQAPLAETWTLDRLGPAPCQCKAQGRTKGPCDGVESRLTFVRTRHSAAPTVVPQGRPFLFKVSYQGMSDEAHFSTKQPRSCTASRLPSPDVDSRRPCSDPRPSGTRTHKAFRLTTVSARKDFLAANSAKRRAEQKARISACADRSDHRGD
ncbi:MAG: hypothetical protein JWO15_1425 [Sphingomonadales bacterium]|nr:hypothetical protein [Sphingomonadales bacterium]